MTVHSHKNATQPDWLDELEKRYERRQAHRFAKALMDEDADKLRLTMDALHYSEWESLRHALRDGAERRSYSAAFRKVMLAFCLKEGDKLRSTHAHHFFLTDFMRVLLPPYRGQAAVTLYRGETWSNRKHRTYGWTWSADKNVAREYAHRMRLSGGSVLLRARTPSSAIVCTPAFFGECNREKAGYVVDRRCLRDVIVLERYADTKTKSPRPDRSDG